MPEQIDADPIAIFVSRVLACKTPAQGEGEVSVKILRPEAAADGADWSCTYTIRGLGLESSKKVGGADALQALLLALKGLRAELDFHERRGCRFAWMGMPGHGLG